MGNQLGSRGHIDPVHVWIANRWRCRSKIDLLCPCIARHVDNLSASCTAHNRVIHQHHVFAFKLQWHRVQLLAHGFLALVLPGHNERAPNVTIFHQTLAELDAQLMGHGLSRNAAGIRYGNDDIDFEIRTQPANLFAQCFPLPHPGLVNRNSIHQRIGSGEIDMLEYAGVHARALRTLAPMEFAIHINKDRFARCHIADHSETQYIERDTLGGEHIVGAPCTLASADHQWPDTQRVAKTQDTVIKHQRHRGIATAAAPVHCRHSGKYVICSGTQLTQGLHFMGEHIE